jgi:arsenate reductase
MAEGFAHEIAGERWDARSAGVEVHGLNPLAVQVMAEKNIDISRQESTLIDEGFLSVCDVVVTLCGDARDRCPAVSRRVRRLHWDLPDPAAAQGIGADQLKVFRAVRDEIEERISILFRQQTQPKSASN